MDETLRATLLAMARHDREVLERLAADGSLFAGYHPEMQAVHEANAAGEMAAVSGDFKKLTGRAPESLESFLDRTA